MVVCWLCFGVIWTFSHSLNWVMCDAFSFRGCFINDLFIYTLKLVKLIIHYLLKVLNCVKFEMINVSSSILRVNILFNWLRSSAPYRLSPHRGNLKKSEIFEFIFITSWSLYFSILFKTADAVPELQQPINESEPEHKHGRFSVNATSWLFGF